MSMSWEDLDADGNARDDVFRRRYFRYQQLVEFSPDGHLVTDNQGVILQANLAAASVLACPKEFLVGKPLGLFMDAKHRPLFYERLSGISKLLQPHEFETRVHHRGRFHDVSVLVSVIDEGLNGEPGLRWLLRDITARRRAEEARDELMQRLVSAQEEERRRVARELHDSVGQLLTALLLSVRAARDSGPLPAAALERLGEIQSLADELGRTAHSLATQLRPTVLDDVGLVAALRHHLEDWSDRTGVPARFQTFLHETARFDAEVETTLYRVVQEALTNVARHAEASEVSVVVEQQGGRAIAVVEDDGKGFDPDGGAGVGRLGLLGMRERVAALGGTLEVESSPGHGTAIIARVPLQRTFKRVRHGT